MSVEFLSDKQADGFGCFHAAPRPEQLSQFFDLRPANQTLLATRWRPANKLECGVQPCTLRFLGTFLPDPLLVPDVGVQTVAGQVGVLADVLAAYRRQLNTW